MKLPSNHFTFSTELSDVPTELHIVPLGQYEHELYGNFTITEDDLDNMVKNFNNQENDLVIDFEHQTLSGEQAPAAGWIKKLKKKDDGIWAVDIEFTSDAIGYIEKKEYRYISPVIDFNASDSKTGNGIGAKIHSIALTNTPWFDGMHPIAAKNKVIEGLIALGIYKTDIKSNKKEDNKMFEKIKEILGLDSKLTDEEVIVAVQKFNDEHQKGNDDLKAMFKDFKLKEDASLVEMITKFKEIQTENDTLRSASTDSEKKITELTTQVVTLVAKDKTREAEKVVDDAIKAGKILPSNRDHYVKFAEKDAELFENTVKVMPVLTKFEQQFYADNADTGDGSAMTEFLAKIKEAREKNSKLTEGEAQKLVLKENPGLDKRYLAESRQRSI